MERITEAARTNKAQVYGYFGSKEGLFDAVVEDLGDRIMSAVAFDADDLPGSAVALYDQSLHHPQLVRLTAWLRLERRPTGLLSNTAAHEAKIAAIARAQAAGTVRQGDPLDVLNLLVAMALAWSPLSAVYTASYDDEPGGHDARRALLRTCVERALTLGH